MANKNIWIARAGQQKKLTDALDSGRMVYAPETSLTTVRKAVNYPPEYHQNDFDDGWPVDQELYQPWMRLEALATPPDPNRHDVLAAFAGETKNQELEKQRKVPVRPKGSMTPIVAAIRWVEAGIWLDPDNYDNRASFSTQAGIRIRAAASNGALSAPLPPSQGSGRVQPSEQGSTREEPLQ